MHLAGRRKTMKKPSLLQEQIWKCGETLCSLLFPKRCVVCDGVLVPEETDAGIHKKCQGKLHPVRGAVCMRCGRPLSAEKTDAVAQSHITREYCYECQGKKSYIIQGKSLFLYKGEIKKTMYRLKYANKREYAPFFAKVAQERYGNWLRQQGIEAIVPVPMYLPKQKKRGYNQAQSFAKALSRQTGIPIADDLVVRVKDTPPLKLLNPSERKNNLKNAFQKGKSIVQYSQILVVDDIYTTGSTAEAVAETLHRQGVVRVYFMSMCIGENR